MRAEAEADARLRSPELAGFAICVVHLNVFVSGREERRPVCNLSLRFPPSEDVCRIELQTKSQCKNTAFWFYQCELYVLNSFSFNLNL